MKPERLSPRAGKVLRYVAARTKSGNPPVKPDDCTNRIKWSDLPHTHLQAVSTLSGLAKRGLVEKVKQGYSATAAGIELIALADKKGLWRSPPPPSVTNRRRRK